MEENNRALDSLFKSYVEMTKIAIDISAQRDAAKQSAKIWFDSCQTAEKKLKEAEEQIQRLEKKLEEVQDYISKNGK